MHLQLLTPIAPSVPLPSATCCSAHALPDTLPSQHRPLQALQALSGRPPDVSHLLGAHQEANRLASTAVGGQGSDVAVGSAGGAGRAVASQAGQRVRGAIVLDQLTEVLLSPLETQLHGEQRLELQPLDGAQKDHRFWGRTEGDHKVMVGKDEYCAD